MALPLVKGIHNLDERLRLLSNAFRVEPPGVLRGKTVLLFDDLYRSGATLRAVTSVLYDQGEAKRVEVLTLTRTRSKR